MAKFTNKTGSQVEADLMLNGPQLSTKEKVSRALRSQSGWLFVAPALILMLVFTFYPLVVAFIGAFKQDYNAIANGGMGSFNGWGFTNFGKVFRSEGTGGANFWQCLVNTLVFTLVSVPLSTLLALLISVALNSIKAVQKAYQTILFLPYLTNSLAMGAVFATFFKLLATPAQIETHTASIGLINTVFTWFGMDPAKSINWIDGTEAWALGSVSIYWAKYIVIIIYEVWSGLPFKILILFSALQSVNKQYYDAARIDGASRSTILWKITAPMISPQISYLLVTGIMGGMKQYTAVVGIFGNMMGTNYEMGTVVGYIYKFTESADMGYAFAGSLILFAIIMIITAINMRVTSKRTTYR